MPEHELQRLSRKDLLELMLAQGRELEKLKTELKEAQEALQNREIAINEAGSIAVAALQINGIFEVAQAASQQYVENIQRLNDRQTAICAQRDADSRAKANRLLGETAEKCRSMELETRQKCETAEAECLRKCEAMEAEAKERAEAYWQEVSQRLQTFFETHQELKKLLNYSAQIEKRSLR